MASSKASPDDNETDSTILIKVYINKEYEKRENFGIGQDIWKLAELERDGIEMDRLREDIPHAFRKAKIFKHLFNNKQYEMQFYSYNAQKADIEIDDDDDLETEVAAFFDEPDSDPADTKNENKYLKLRAVFSKRKMDNDMDNDMDIDGLHSLQAPQLQLKRMRHYVHKEEEPKPSRVAIAAELEWKISPDILRKHPSANFIFRIKENLVFGAHEYVSQILNKTSEELSPLDVNREYEFQINMFNEEMPSLPASPWSQPLRIRTPSPPNRIPTPTHLTITTLLPQLIQIRWDAGFAPDPQHKITYYIKEYLQFSQHPFVAQYNIPIGKLSPLQPNTRYQITVYTSYRGKDSPESKGMQVLTPPIHFHQVPNYKPSPPLNIQQTLNAEYNEILLYWVLPPNTFGTNIHYIVFDLPQNPPLPVVELPFRVPRPMHATPIRIVTVTNFNNRDYQSDATQIILQGAIQHHSTKGGPHSSTMRTHKGGPTSAHKGDTFHTSSSRMQSAQLQSAAHSYSPPASSTSPATSVEARQSLTGQQFSVLMDYIHDSQNAKQIIFNKKIDFNQFKQHVIDTFGIVQHLHDVLQFGIMKGKSISRLHSKNFTFELPQLYNSSASQLRLYVGVKPEVPIIEKITSEMIGQFNIKLKQTLTNTFRFAIEAKDPNDLVQFSPNSTTSLHMVINGLKPKGEYRVRAIASNVFGKSKWSSFTPYKYPDNNLKRGKEDLAADGAQGTVSWPPPAIAHQSNDEGVLKSDPSVRYILFFADKGPSETSYCLNPYKSDEFHPFYIVDKSRYAYLCIYQDRNAKDLRDQFMFNIMTTKYKSTQQKYKLVKHNDSWPRQNSQSSTWTINGGEALFYVDFNNWNQWTKHSHYESIATCIMNFVLKCLGKELAPLSVLRIIFKSYHFLTGSRGLMRRNAVKNIFADSLNKCYNKIRSVKTWREMSTMLVCLAVLWTLETTQNKYIGDTQLATIFQHLCSAKRGATEDILVNIKHTFGEYVSYLMDKLTKKILDERQQITKYGYCIWYNVLHCVVPDYKPANSERILSVLYPTNHIQHLFTLVGYDLTFVKHQRAIKLEYLFVRSLLSPKHSAAQQLSARMKYDFIVQLLAKLTDIEQVYEFLLSFKTDLRNLIGNDTESWFGFVYYMLSDTVCKIPKGKAMIDLQLSKAVIKSMELTSELFCFKVELINEQKDAEKLYKLCTGYPVIMDQKIRQSILKNEYLISRVQFVPFIANLLRPVYEPDTWKQTLTKCVGVWINFHGLTAGINIIKNFHLDSNTFEEYCVDNDISGRVPAEMDKKFEMITDITLPNEIRRIVSLTITRTWRQFNANERDYIIKGTVCLLQNDLVESADIILRNVLAQENPFGNKNDVAMINYLVSPVGKNFIELLSALRRTKNYDQLGIKDRLAAFHSFWIEKLSNIAAQQTQVAVVDILSQHRYENFGHIHRAFEQSGGVISSVRSKECQKLFETFNKAKVFKGQIDTFFQTFAPSQIYWANDIQDLHTMYAKLENWHDLSLHSIITGNWGLVSSNSDLLRMMEQMSKSKICVSIWKALIQEQENKWNMKQLRNMGIYEVADWIRSMRREYTAVAPEFNLEIFVQIIYDKELNGRQLRKDEIDNNTLQKWFAEWNESAHFSETVNDQIIERVIALFFDALRQRKEMEKQLRGIGPGEKKFDTKKLNQLVQKLRDQWNETKIEINQNRLTVKTIQKYFGMLSHEKEAIIAQELDLMLQLKKDDAAKKINIKNIAQNIGTVFQCIAALDSARTVRDATQLFQQLLRDSSAKQQKVIEDDAWKARLDLLMTDVSERTIDQLKLFWNTNKKYLLLLSNVSQQWLVTLASKRKCISQLYERFHDNAQFEKHMQIFGASDPIQQTRAISLTNVRNLIVNFLNQKFQTLYAMHDALRTLAQNINQDDLNALEVVVTSWNHLLIDTFDPTQYRFQQDKEVLVQLTQFMYSNEEDLEQLQEEGGPQQYLHAILGEAKHDDEQHQQMLPQMSQNEFDAFTDRLLMFMAGDQGNVNVSDVPIRPIFEMNVEDVVDLFKARTQNLLQCGIQKFSDLETLLRRHDVNGLKLIEAFKQSKHDLTPMINMLFGANQRKYDNDKQDKITNEIRKVVDFQLLRDKVQNDLIPKFDLCKKIAKHRLLYYSEGGRDKLDENRHIPIEKTLKGFAQIEQNWCYYVTEWEQRIEKLRIDFNVLTFYTVNDMRWILAKINAYINQGAGPEKDKFLRELHSSFCFIDSSLRLDEVKIAVQRWQQKKPKTMRDLGQYLQEAFGKKIKHVISLNEFDFQFLASGHPHLFLCQQRSAVLRTVMKLFLSQGQQPAASRVLFCNHTTTLEEIECLLMRSNLRLSVAKKQTSSVGPLLHVLVQPERLKTEIQDGFLKIMNKYVYKNWSLFAIVTANARNRIYFQLQAFSNYTQRAFTETERKNFFNHILCADFQAFNENRNQIPLCAVYMSRTECVGKSHVIREIATKNNHGLVHVPINTKAVDVDFIVNRLLSTPDNMDGDTKIVYHINVSSDAGMQVNEVMFELLVLRYLKKSGGGSFNANANHAFLVELPSQLSSTLRATNIDDVRDYFYFLAGNKSYGVLKYEVQDSLRPVNQPIIDPQNIILNKLQLTPKEMFVLKYLDAYKKELLTITGRVEDNWDHTKHPKINDDRMLELVSEYCQQGASSLVFLKSYLRYMYRQLIQLYTASLFVDNSISWAVDGAHRFVQYHVVIAQSMIQSAPHIACHMYTIPAVAIHINQQRGRAVAVAGDERGSDDDEDNKDDEKMLDETTGEEEFFLVKYWAETETPMVLLNQRPINESYLININATTLEQDLDSARKANTCTFSLLAMNLDKNNSWGAKEWKLYREVMKSAGSLNWSLYNFEQDRKQREEQMQKVGFANETSQQQMEKLSLLLRICGGFKSEDPELQNIQLETLYEQNKDYALTFDNILKIVAIFFRVNSGIPVLIMGETGCGKTKLLQFMSTALDITMYTIDVHGGYSIGDLQRNLIKPIQFAKVHNTNTVLVFLDEVNTSPDCGGFKEVICDHSLKGVEFPDNMVIIAALNPYRKRHKTKEQLEEEKLADANNPKHFVDDLDRQMGSLVYRVFPLPPSLKTYVWNFGALSRMDEQQYIAVMTRTTWDDQEFLEACPFVENFEDLRNCFIDLICRSQQFLRIELNDKSVCSLRDVKRANRLFLWFFNRANRKNKHPVTRVIESMFLAIAQCYYYRLNQRQRQKFKKKIENMAKQNLGRTIEFKKIIDAEQFQYVQKLKIEPGIAINRAFRENLFVMLVGLSTKTPTVIVGKPGSSKTLAMVTLQDNLSSATKNDQLTKMGFDDYSVVSFQCSKLTTAASIEQRWTFAEDYEKRLNERRDPKTTLPRSVIMFLDEVGLAEQSPHRPLKVLHKLLENPKIAFIGLSNWQLDSAKMNRVVLHNVLPPNERDLSETAEKIMTGVGDNMNMMVANHLTPRIPQIAAIYESIMKDKENNPFQFDFFGHRDFYNLVSYLKYRLQQNGVSLKDDMVLVEAVLRNFGGETKQQAEDFMFPKVAEKILSSGNIDNEQIWRQFSPLTLIRDNIRQTRDLSRNKSYELRNIMLITESPVMWKILFDSEILGIAQTEVIFGSKFKNDIGSTIYLYRTIEKVRGAMQTGKVCVLLKLEQLYDSLYDVLNQRYLNVDNQKFCRICIGGESIRCQIHHTFRCIVVVPRQEAHHLTANTDDFTPVAFLNRFEKQYLDPTLLQDFGIGSGNGWTQKWNKLKSTINRKYTDHLVWRTKDLFIGFNKTYTFVSLLTTEIASEHIERKETEDDEFVMVDDNGGNEKTHQDAVENCYHMLLKTTSIEYLIQDQRKLRKIDFIAYASLIDLLQREGISNDSGKHMLLRVLTHDTYQMPLDFMHKLQDKEYEGTRVQVSFENETKVDSSEEESKININNLNISGSNVHTLLFKEITSFMREMDFYNYVYDFFNSADVITNTLIIVCEPANSTEKLIHYLHAQYLTEKAREAAKRPHVQHNKPKNVVFLVYMSRQTPYPLIFNREWKHLFLDALLPADHRMFPQIQINDINIFEMNDQRIFEKRVQHHTDRIVFNSYEKAMNLVVVASDSKRSDSNIRDEIERIKSLLDVDNKTVEDNGAFRKVLVERIQKVLLDKKSGAIDCLKKTLKNRKRDDRGSIRGHVMEKLAEKIKDQLVEILTIIFSNGNSNLYYGDEQQQDQDMRLARLWLKLVSEPRILRIVSTAHIKNTRVSVDRTLSQAQFPFSSHIHSYLSSYKDDCLRAWVDDKIPIIESGVKGQNKFTTDMQNKLHAANLSIPIDNLPENFVRKLSKDIVLLEATRLGLRRHSDAIFPRLVKFVDEFLWKASNDVHAHALRARKPHKNKKVRKMDNKQDGDGGIVGIGDNTGFIPAEEDSSDDEEDNGLVLGIDSDESEEEDDEEEEKKTEQEIKPKVEEIKEEKKEDEEVEEEDEVEEQTVQIHEVYASLWANEKIILQCIDVLSVLKESPIQLAAINREWTAKRSLGACLSAIMTRLLDKLHELLIGATSAGLKERVDYLLATSQSFEDLLRFLSALQVQNVIGLQKKWSIIRLSMICVSACGGCIAGTFINDLKNRFGDHRFDNLQKLGGLIQLISDAIQRKKQKVNADHIQWFVQNYIRFFAFHGEKISNQFAQSLISIIAEEESRADDELTIVPNAFTKFEIASQFLKVMKSNDMIKNILSIEVQNREFKSVIATLLSRAHEQHLHHELRSRYSGDVIRAPKKREILATANKLHESFNLTKLDQLLAISECKVTLYYFIRYLQSILDAKGEINLKGIYYQKRRIKNEAYLKTIGSILRLPQQGSDGHIRVVKNGLQYFFVSEIWNMGGAQKALQLVSNPVFPQILGLELFKDDLLDDEKVPDYVPKDDIFQLVLAANDDDEKVSKQHTETYEDFERMVAKDERINRVFERKYYVHLIGAIFNRGYLRGGSNQFANTLKYLSTSINQDLQAYNKQPVIKQRVSGLLTNLLCNYNNCTDKTFQLKTKRTLEDIQIIRLCLHFVSVILSLPQNPFAKLFHNPTEMKKEYLCGMPEDSSAALLKVMAGHGVWLCPNDHVYFVGNCTATNGTGKCTQCGAPIGNKVGAKSHTAATGNRRIGKIDKNGKIIPNNPYGGATEGMAEYNAEKLAPKGYVYIEGSDDVCRGLTEISVRIVRFFNNAVLLLHAIETETSVADNFTLLHKDEVSKKLKGLVSKCIKSLSEKMNLSFESIIYLMHQMVHNFYLCFETKYGAKGISKIKDSKSRKAFEDWMVETCIKPVTLNPRRVISSVREKVTKSRVVLKWAKRFGEQMDLQSDEGREFAKNYLPNIFLSFRLLTLSTFKEKLLENKQNSIDYPVTWGILNTIDTSAGYSVFALKYLPAMITWMKLLQTRLNQRLNLDEILSDPAQYSCNWVMDKCKNENWGEIKVWNDAFNGFVAGWNHLASRVTTDKNLEDAAIDTVGGHINVLNIPDPNNDDEKDEMKDEKDDEDLIRMARKNQFKKFVKIANVCEALPIKPFVSKAKQPRKDIKPIDVPLIYALDTGINGKLDSSIMIRKMIQHYITVNNKVLRECYQLQQNDADEYDYDDGNAVGLQPGLDSQHISRTRDVVDIDEEEFREIIQECAQQKLKYGDNMPYTLNLRLLETRLRERYITGRKVLIESAIEFEFAGQFNIPQVISKINRQYATTKGDNLQEYFEKSPPNLIQIIQLNIQQKAQLNFNQIGDDDRNQFINNQHNKASQTDEHRQKQRTLDAYGNALQAVEQTLIALERQKNLPSAAYSLGSYMKDNLHLYPQEYDPFIRIQALQLKHLEHIWRDLERLYLIEEGTWHEIPQTTMELYKNQIDDEGLKTALQQFVVRHEMDQLWNFLSAFRRFLVNNCHTELAKNPHEQRLLDFLQYADDIDEELINVFPMRIMLNQAGYAYYHTAKYYQERNEREAQQPQ